VTTAHNSLGSDAQSTESRYGRPVLVPDPEPAADTMHGRVAALKSRRAEVESGSDNATERQHDKGKLTVRERLEVLLDPGTFTEFEPFRQHRSSGFGLEERRPDGDGVVTGCGRIDGRPVYVYAHDFRIFGGALGEAHAAKIHRVMDRAISAGAPLISLSDGAGARIQEGVTALAGYGGIFARNSAASGLIPQISVVLGPCAGGAAYSPALTDFVFMVRDIAQLFVTGPDVISKVTGESVSHEDLGGADVHGATSGVASFVYDDETTCLDEVRLLVSMLPQNNRELPPAETTEDPASRSCPELLDLVPVDPNQSYDMSVLIDALVDEGTFLEYQEGWARNLICGLARIDGDVVGIVANQPAVLAGTLDIDASDKGARFVSTCDAFNIPIVTLLDVPGFLPGTDQEHRGLIRHGAKLLYAYCNATVPRIQLIVRKAYGGAYIVMDSLSIGTDLSLAWPSNEIAVMGAEGAAAVVFRRDIAAARDPDATRDALVDKYRSELMHPYYAAERGLVDDIIDPAETRPAIARGLAMLRGKHAQSPDRKHGNPPV
jgi:methylmalonyl-CoA decarboxylase subunit alpha